MKRAALLLLLGASGTAGACTPLPASLMPWVDHAARAHGIHPDLFHAMIQIESRYCVDAVSKKGAIGLGQLMPGTARDLRVNPRDPVQNLYGSARYLRGLWDEFRDWRLALAAYNAGRGTVRRFGGIPPYAETQAHVRKVMGVYEARVARQGRGVVTAAAYRPPVRVGGAVLSAPPLSAGVPLPVKGLGGAVPASRPAVRPAVVAARPAVAGSRAEVPQAQRPSPPAVRAQPVRQVSAVTPPAPAAIAVLATPTVPAASSSPAPQKATLPADGMQVIRVTRSGTAGGMSVYRSTPGTPTPSDALPTPEEGSNASH